MRFTNRQIAIQYRRRMCTATHTKRFADANWLDIWSGFVIALGRPDLANYTHYMILGFPEEQNMEKSA